MQILNLSKNKKTTVDNENFELLNQWKWSYDGNYAVRKKWINKKQIRFLLHRQIMGFPKGLEIDHINRDKLDNRKSNLRIVTREQNVNNMPKYSTNKSGYKGVSFDKNRKKWKSTISIKGKHYDLGRFESKEKAYLTYINKALEIGRFL